jgi:hypothetical protein
MHLRALLSLAALAAGLLLPARLSATTVMPLPFDDLVAGADFVVHAVVKSVSSEWQENQGHRNIITKITLEVRTTVAGTAPATLVLVQLGGQVGQDRLEVSGSPQFAVGDEDILFVQGNGRQLSPLVGMMYGRFPVVHDAATHTSYIARSNGAALYSAQEVAQPLGRKLTHPAAANPLTLDRFIQQIRLSSQNHRTAAKQL